MYDTINMLAGLFFLATIASLIYVIMKAVKKQFKKSLLLIPVALFVIYLVICVICPEKPAEEEQTNQAVESQSTEVSATESATTEPETTEQATEKQTEEKNPLGFNVLFSDTYRNDVTGNWCLARIAQDIDIEKYALDYYKNYFESDSEIHIIINFTRNTTTRIIVMGNILDVTTMDYVDGEEHDAKIACSGTVLSEYFVYTDSEKIEQIQ